ncbi:ABC transporter substrate-binding protein [Rhodococcus sp. ACT016]|uniref:ABC transporter substrate-binding protein n=1 Tax=Rhodococcus sp. ACT016 TaxID=3134808 RepID=UPI003D27B177
MAIDDQPEVGLTVSTPLGTYDIPREPNRVFAVDSRTDFETAVALGLSVVATSLRAPTPWVPAPDGIQILDGPINLEQVIKLEPDLIVCSGVDDGEYWPTTALNKIAPVLPTDFQLGWKNDLTRTADWLGRRDRAESLIAEYDQKLVEVRRRHESVIERARVVHLQYVPSSASFIVNARGRLQTEILSDMGGHLFGDEHDATADAMVSLEVIGQYGGADGFLVQNTDSTSTLASMNNLPIWRDLPAVREGRVVETRGNVNYGGIYTAGEVIRNWSALYDTM